MKCPKCGGEIPFYDLKPNCKHCGVNIMYFKQEYELSRDAKRTELESAVARMVIARIKAQFIGGKLQIARMIAVIAAVAGLLIPFITVNFNVPFFNGKFTVGLLGLINAFQNGMLLKLPSFLSSSLFSSAVKPALIICVLFVIITLIALVILAAYILGFLNLSKSAKVIKIFSIIGCAVSAVTQILVLVFALTGKGSEIAFVSIGFGAVASFVLFLVVLLINNKLVKNGIEPEYRENDLKRKALLKQVRKGEVNLDDLPLPVFESDEEREERLKALEEALKAEEEGKEL